jgi:DNA-3-methyladenine glycosylase II
VAAPRAVARRGAQVVKPPYWDEATRTLAAGDPVLGALIASYPGIHLARRSDPFTTLARAIVGQQISVKAADAIWGRFVEATDGGGTPVRLDPDKVGRKRLPTLRRAGLSENKALYLRDLARHFTSGALDPREWPAIPDEALIERLVDVKGIGRWTAEMFLIFHLMRPNVLPLDDIGLLSGISRNYFSGDPVSRSDAREVAAAWAPYCSVATWYIWRSLDPLPVEY